MRLPMCSFPSAHSTLIRLLKACSPLAIAFSGGLDSRFLAFMAHTLASEGVLAHLYLFYGPHQTRSERRDAERWAEQRGMPLTVLELNPLEHPDVRGNTAERCYHCKRLLFQALQQELATHPPFPGRAATLCDGSNASDRASYRPGERAVKECSVQSPLAEAGLGKKDIRALGAELGFDNPGQHARPCLLTRYAYGVAADIDSLAAIERAEDNILRLLEEAAPALGWPAPPEFRLRLVSAPDKGPRPLSDHGVELHIGKESPPAKLRAALQKAVTEQGFALPELKILDSVSGYYDNRREGQQ